MEGLIPLVYRALKKNKTRQQYQCLSSGAALVYNPEDFFVNDAEIYMKASTEKGNEGRKLHRRYSSVENISVSVAGESPPPQKQLVRFRSHRRMFSCVTGA